MQVTNRLDLPPQLVRALLHQDLRYSRGNSHISVTQLLSSPRQVALREAHMHEIVEDVSENIFRLLGSVLHKILELGAEDDGSIIEKRVTTIISGWRVSGGIDVQIVDEGRREVHILDWKLTSSMTVMAGRSEWAEQLNCYAAMLRREGWTVTGVENIAVIRDWSKGRIEVPKYPQAAVVRIHQPLWSAEEADQFLTDRVTIHQEAVAMEMLGDPLPFCTDEERWNRGDSYALVSDSGRAVKVGQTVEEIEEWHAASKRKYSGSIERRPGLPIRCMSYCPAAPWCDQWANERGVEIAPSTPQ